MVWKAIFAALLSIGCLGAEPSGTVGYGKTSLGIAPTNLTVVAASVTAKITNASIYGISSVLRGDGIGGSVAATPGLDYAASSHTHDAADIVSGTIAKVRGGTGADNSAVTFPSSGTITISTDWDTVAKIETATGQNIITSDEIDTQAKLEALIGSSLATDAEVAAVISDVAYDATSWDGVTTIAPSKNAVRDEIESILSGMSSVSVNGATVSNPNFTNSPSIAFEVSGSNVSAHDTIWTNNGGTIRLVGTNTITIDYNTGSLTAGAAPGIYSALGKGILDVAVSTNEGVFDMGGSAGHWFTRPTLAQSIDGGSTWVYIFDPTAPDGTTPYKLTSSIARTLGNSVEFDNDSFAWNGTITPGNIAASKAIVSDSASGLTNSVTTSTELGYVSGVTNSIQTQLDSKLTSSSISDTAYDATSWDGVTTVAPSKNAVRDEVETLVTSIATKQDSDSDLTALAGNTSNGLWARTGTGTGSARTITAGNGMSLSNGDGVSGNPTVTWAPSIWTSSTLTLGDSSQATLVYTIGLSGATDPAWTYGNSSADLTTGTLKQGGTAVALQSRSISTTSPLSGGGDLSADRTLSIPAATGSVNGYLTSSDWTTFNGKVSTTRSISTGAGLSGGGDLSADRTLTWAPETRVNNVTVFDGSQASRTWTFDLSGTDPVITFGSSSVDVTTGTLKQGGTAVALQSRSISTGVGLSGGGDLSNDRTLTWAPETRVANVTLWDGSQSSRTLTYDLSGTDPVWTIGSSSVDLTTGTLKQGGTAVALQSRNISTGAGLSGGGDLSTDRTLTWDASTFVGNVTLWDASQASRTVTANLSGATDPVWTYSNNSADLTTGVLKYGGNTVATSANDLSFFAATTSAQLRGVLSDESGTGAAIFAGGNIGAASATTPSTTDNTTTVATTAFVNNNSQYSLCLVGGSSSPSDATTYYIGGTPQTMINTVYTDAAVDIPKTGTITRVFVRLRYNNGASTEQFTLSLRLNNSTDTTITTVAACAGISTNFTTTVSIPVSAGDTIAVKQASPTWATNPSAYAVYALVFIQ